MLHFLYHTAPGRVLLKLLCCPVVSRICGAFLSCPLSKPFIRPFIRRNRIDLTQYEAQKYSCFNDCFTRKIKPELRPIAAAPFELIAPCDGLLSAYRIENGLVMSIKNSRYTVDSLLKDKTLAARYQNGYCLVFRLCVEHYHRYCYADSGNKGDNIFIPGVLHTVRPIATESLPVFTENCREFTVIESQNFGRMVQMEIGAMLVGKIHNLHGQGKIQRGQEKGMFLYGGSTVVLLIEQRQITLPETLCQNTESGIETPVKMGQAIAYKTARTVVSL